MTTSGTIERLKPIRPSERIWMWTAILIFLAFVISWIPSLGLPLGDGHQGRILGRMALHADNFVERGWAGSNFIADWMPYSSVPYAHHPPLSQFIHAGVAWLQGGATSLGVRMVDYAGGVVSIGLIGAFVRKLTGSWLPTALSLGGLAVSGFFWLFGRGLGLFVVFAFFAVHLIARKNPGRLTMPSLAVLAMLGALLSWQTAFTIGLLALYDFFTGRRKQATFALVGIAVGFGLDVLWIESAAGIRALSSHLEARVAAANYGPLEWLTRQVEFLLRFEAIPVVIVTLFALVVGLRDIRFRPYVGVSFISVVVFAVLFYQNAWVHEYWNWRISLVLALGMGATGTWLINKRPPDWWYATALLAAIVMTAVPALRLGGDLYVTQYVEPAHAGALVQRAEFPDDQTVAWHYGGISGPRWYAWYTGLPVRSFDLDNPGTSGSLVLVKRQADNALDDADLVDSQGQYALIKVNDLLKVLKRPEQ